MYKDQLAAAMRICADQPNSIFIGQSIVYGGTGMFQSFEGIPKQKLIEAPVAENLQLGISTGMSLNGFLPISVYPRINFLLLAMDQLVLHLDVLPRYSNFRPKVIIRTAVASDKPLNPGRQHLGDFSLAIKYMLSTVEVVLLESSDQIVPAYNEAVERPTSSLLVEYVDLYETE